MARRTGKTSRAWPRRAAWLGTLLLLGAGCAKPPGVIFPRVEPPLVWPQPPDQPRIRYVGQLGTNEDLKPGRSAFQGFGQALFGKREVYSMLSPFALATDRRDRLFVADNGAQLVHVFDLKTRKYQRWAPNRTADGKIRREQPGFTQPVAVAWDPAGRLLVSDSLAGLIYVFDARGVPRGHIGQGLVSRPAGIVVDPATGRIFVADVMGHQVIVLSRDGQLLQRVGQRGERLGEFNYPTNVALDPQGRLYVSDSLNFRVQQFSPDLKPMRQIGEQGDVPGTFAQPKGLATDSAGHLYVVDARFENVQIFNDRGQLLLYFGEEGSGPGHFWLPAGIFIDGQDRIWIADAFNRRVAVFDYLHAPEAEPPPQTQPKVPVTTRPVQQPEATTP